MTSINEMLSNLPPFSEVPTVEEIKARKDALAKAYAALMVISKRITAEITYLYAICDHKDYQSWSDCRDSSGGGNCLTCGKSW